jgi:hypothetical protein
MADESGRLMTLLQTVTHAPAAFFAWLRAEDYEEAKRRATAHVVARFGRGNVAVQNGFVLDEADLKKRGARGSAAIDRLARDLPATPGA